MENVLNYFYDIKIQNIRHRNDVYFIKSGTSLYALEKCDNYIDKLDSIYQLNLYMIYNNIYVYEIIKNKFNNIATQIENNNYILFKINDQYDKKITVDMLFSFQYKVPIIEKLKVNEWKKMWSNKIDFFEYQMSKMGLKFPLLRESMSYYIGMAENAITAMTEVLNDDLYLQHRRISAKSTYYDFFNPLNIVLDTRVRDFCEYYKSNFMHEIDQKKLGIINIFERLNYTDNEMYLFYIRMFFPTFYFDISEKIIQDSDNENKLYMILNKIDEYQLLLSELNAFFSIKIMPPDIKWIHKK